MCIRDSSGTLRHYGEEHEEAIFEALNYATDLFDLRRFEEAKSLLRRRIPVARRVLGETHDLTLRMRMNYAGALYNDDEPTLDDIREAVGTLEEIERTARRVFGGAHPTVSGMEHNLRNARAKLAAREGDVESVREAVEAMAPGDA